MGSNPPENAASGKVRKLMIFFLLAYIAEGMCMETGIVSQPLAFYLKTSLGWDAPSVTKYLTVLLIPWVIKPFYGLLSDFVPLLGYRRKSWLFIANAGCTVAYIWLMGLTAPSQIIISLVLSMVGMAASSALCQAIMVENGKVTGMSARFVNQQWLWAAVGLVISSVGGGLLCQYFLSEPVKAFHYAALVAAIIPVGAFVGCWFLVDEPNEPISKEKLKASARGFGKAFVSPTLWVVALFLACFNLNPSAGQSLFFYQTDKLLFSQEFIGMLAGIGAVGAIGGSLLYMYFLTSEKTPRAVSWFCRHIGLACLYRVLGTAFAGLCRLVGWQRGDQFFQGVAGEFQSLSLMKALVYLSIFLGITSQASFYFLAGPTSAVFINLFTQIGTQVTVVTMLTLAAHACPDDAEGFSYAFILSFYNLGGQLGANAGAHLYEHWFHQQYSMLPLISAAVTSLCFLLAPLLPKSSLEPPSGADR
jgi:hypothetical protein